MPDVTVSNDPSRKSFDLHLASRVLLLVFVCLLMNCGVNNVVIDGSFPTPNISKLPLSVAVYYDAALRDFAYMEYSETGTEEFNIQSGQSHLRLFNAVLPAMFEQVVELNEMEEAKTRQVDAVFMPLIEEFQLALPSKTKLGVYEVWIKYNMRLVTPEGDYIADWVLTSYGKTPTDTFLSAEAGINEAAVVALRDLASSFSLTFSQVPEVRDWLASL
ncbi:MAG: hypothetical protein OXE78_07890 [Gammaproteobacteria bacterium]|nr:hypothetical protein [Gammaproteobacteria bacterium]MCY4356997.1 hypothetical protein [Gammaproteobacteria bacterium]